MKRLLIFSIICLYAAVGNAYEAKCSVRYVGDAKAFPVALIVTDGKMHISSTDHAKVLFFNYKTYDGKFCYTSSDKQEDICLGRFIDNGFTFHAEGFRYSAPLNGECTLIKKDEKGQK